MTARPEAANHAERLADDPGRWRFGRVLRPILLFGAVAHAVFLGLFWWLQVPVLIGFNLGSLLLYAGLILAVPHLETRWTVLPAALEVLAHAWLATHYLGWQAGFHFYPLILIPLLAFLTALSLGQRCLLVLLCTLFYAALAAAYTGEPAAVAVPQWFVPWLNAANVISVATGMSVFILFYAVAVDNADSMLGRARDRLERLAATDPLTGLLNRRSMDDRLRETVAAGGTHSVLLADIDRFKEINDTLGHDTGDEMLKALSRLLRTSMREEDAVARWGGEEFLILLHGQDLAAARAAAERLRAATPHCWSSDADRHLSISIGVATLQPGDTPHALTVRADRALLRAKRSGRDRVVADTDPSP
ncbi:GGDEF domain-containing protein [Aquisalimonas lutea]|uniref:GGDEF domain-containing protein n=1 Tax=Aquisalimonas lutea TaxID=1327750 RepID=UPI0025B61C80|nr:GGDEF domain-containing protein [Aquisalimonas lutea]MDN3518188.1 GGDEF domain-containing protein [Aquisalimonas lutea]